MKFMCDRSSFSEALINVSKAVAERSPVPALEGVRFYLMENKLELTGYDLEIGIRTTIEVRSMDCGSFIADAKLFSEMVRKLPDGEISVEIDSNFFITIESGRTSYNLNAVPADDYPELPDKSSEPDITLPQPVLKSMIVQTKFSASQVDIKPILKGELFEIENNTVTLAAIDGYRLAIRQEPINTDKTLKFVVPAKNLDEVAKLMSDEDDKICEIYLSDKHIIFDIGNYLVTSRLLEGEFHPYKSALPKSHSTEVFAERTKLISSVERAALLINEKNPSPVRCTFEDNQLKIRCATSSIGKFHDEVDIEMTGETMEIGFKAKFLLEPLKAVSDEKVRLQLGGPLKPLVIRPMEGSSYTYLVLPMRLPKD